MWRKLTLCLLICCASCLALWSQEAPPSTSATSQLEQVVLQLRALRTRISGYEETWATLSPALGSLLSDSKTDSESLTLLTSKLSLSEQDSMEVSTLSTRLSSQFSALSISYGTAKLVSKYATVGLVVMAVGLALSVKTKGFTKFN
jgi:hypothetical protein